MAEYLTLIITVALFGGILNAFFDEKGVGKTARTVVNIIMLSCIVIPVMKTLVFFQDKPRRFHKEDKALQLNSSGKRDILKRFQTARPCL